MKEFIFDPVKTNQIVSVPGYLVWCGSMVRTPDGKCHLFISMWEAKWKFEYGWATHSKIGYAVADEPDGKYEFKGIVLEGSGAENGWDRDSVHNPYAVYHDGKFYVYYSGNYGDGVYGTHTANQRIGVAYTTDPFGTWTRFDKPLFENRVGKFDESGTTNPSVCKGPDDRFVMVYKAWSKLAPFNGKVHFGVAFADTPLGPWKRNDEPIFNVPGAQFAGEDPCIYSVDGKLYCLIKDMSNNYIHDIYRAVVRFESDNGIDWKPSEPFFFRSRNIDFEDYGQQLIYRMERPFLYVENGKPRALFTAIRPKLESSFCCNIHMNVRTE